ncbi:type III toxin-antitoxin system ToxN/AbiQ family toxin [uncultured Anaerovibrio sp.]|uniref:type III toxin-antitoxin system ToxN/AbiQ family toxin n=1 Tax=uncultured Anaerovibrio sp. TaxID=361586 RepID=UPI00261BF062|nr:type III toxin-antitoxin system ToxN/AbiQ family toxin [uncultured Anaerovibrio sp.]
MENIKFYEVDEASYIDYLSPYSPHLFRNSKKTQGHTRKYIGVLFHVSGMDYFAPLSSFKAKHEKMKEGMDFLKVGRYAVITPLFKFFFFRRKIFQLAFQRAGRYAHQLL